MLLALLVTLNCLAAWGETVGAYASVSAYDPDHLVVGNPTRLEGNFFTDMWGNNTSDLDVRQLISGLNLVAWDGIKGMFAPNATVVRSISVRENAEGDRTYYFTLFDDLYYSDGSPITAWDYAFSLLLSIAPEIRELGGKPLRTEHIYGYDAYIRGGNKTLTGVRVFPEENRIAVSVRHEYLPFFFEFGLLYCMPYPVSVLAPGCQVKDDGQGVYIDGPFTAELLRQTILDPETGYRSHPSVVSGPYRLLSFDGETAEFEINPYFKGDDRGEKPAIQYLTLTTADNNNMMEKLGNGEFGLLNKVTKADTIQKGKSLVETGNYSTSNYPRTGLTFVSFNGEKETVKSQSVRLAIAHCLDKDALVNDYVGNFGLRVEGFYGMGQWMYRLAAGNMDEIPAYQLDAEAAAQLLEEDGWTLNRQGEAFRAGVDDVRCKEIGGELVPLALTMAYPAGNRMIESMETHFVPYLNEAGITLTFEPKTMQEVLDLFYRRTERTQDMLYLGTNFDVVFDPATHFIPGETGQPTWNYTEIADEELYRDAVEMRMTEPGDTLTYCRRWLEFQKRFAELEPMIPIYSNMYFDFYDSNLQNYNVTEYMTWTQAIIPARLTEGNE